MDKTLRLHYYLLTRILNFQFIHVSYWKKYLPKSLPKFDLSFKVRSVKEPLHAPDLFGL